MKKLTKQLKIKMKNTNINKLCLAVLIVALVFAVIFGAITRHSYKSFDSYDEAIVETTNSGSKNTINALSYKKVKKQLDKIKYAFVIEVKESEAAFYATKTYGTVKTVVKGDKDYEGKDIAVYETCYMDYNKNLNTLYFQSMNNLNMPMKEGETYLVFATKIDYAKEYADTLSCDEFKTDVSYSMYSFPLDARVESVTYKEGITFGDIKNCSYICFDEQDADKLEKIKNMILSDYL